MHVAVRVAKGGLDDDTLGGRAAGCHTHQRGLPRPLDAGHGGIQVEPAGEEGEETHVDGGSGATLCAPVAVGRRVVRVSRLALPDVLVVVRRCLSRRVGRVRWGSLCAAFSPVVAVARAAVAAAAVVLLALCPRCSSALALAKGRRWRRSQPC